MLAVKCKEFLEPKGLSTHDGCSGRNAFLIEVVTGFEALKLQKLRARRCHWSRAQHMVQGTACTEFRRNSWGVAAIQSLHTRAAQQEAKKQSRDFILLELWDRSYRILLKTMTVSTGHHGVSDPARFPSQLPYFRSFH